MLGIVCLNAYIAVSLVLYPSTVTVNQLGSKVKLEELNCG